MIKIANLISSNFLGHVLQINNKESNRNHQKYSHGCEHIKSSLNNLRNLLTTFSINASKSKMLISN